jgi:hypothetical protein
MKGNFQGHRVGIIGNIQGHLVGNVGNIQDPLVEKKKATQGLQGVSIEHIPPPVRI